MACSFPVLDDLRGIFLRLQDENYQIVDTTILADTLDIYFRMTGETSGLERLASHCGQDFLEKWGLFK